MTMASPMSKPCPLGQKAGRNPHLYDDLLGMLYRGDASNTVFLKRRSKLFTCTNFTGKKSNVVYGTMMKSSTSKTCPLGERVTTVEDIFTTNLHYRVYENPISCISMEI